MSSSLLIDGQFDVLDIVNSPVILVPGFDRGAPAPTVSQIESSVLDGSAVTGRAAGNRSINIPVIVRGADRLTVATLVNQVLQLVDQASWELTFTPDGGLPVIFDCYRATVTVTSDLLQDTQGQQALMIQCQALPYGRSPQPVTTPLAGSPVSIDTFDTGPAPTAHLNTANTTATVTYVSTPTPVTGSTGELDVHISSTVSSTFSYNPDITLSRSGLSISSGGSALTNVRFVARTDINPKGRAWSFAIRVTTSGGGLYRAQAPVGLSSGYWTTLVLAFTTPIPAGSTITGWSLEASTTQPTGGGVHLYLDQFVGLPGAAVGFSDTWGATVKFGVTGSARTAVNLALTKVGGGTFKSWLVHSPPADTPNAYPLISLTSGFPTGARYGGTYAVWVSCGTVASPGTPRTWSVGLNQTGPSGSTSVSATVSPVSNSLVYIGTVALPIIDTPDESTPIYGGGISTPAGDNANDLLLLDTRGQTVVVGSTALARANAWIDAPDPTSALGGIWSGASADRSDAGSCAASLLAAGTLIADPGTTTLLIHSPEGLLQGTASYSPRWLQEATS